jgi:hypothetical protein
LLLDRRDRQQLEMSPIITRLMPVTTMSDPLIFIMKYLRINSRPLRVLSFVCLGFLAGCSVLQPQKIESGSELSKGATLAGLTTFRFLPNRVMAEAEAVSNTPYWYSQVGKAVTENLSAKGYHHVETGKSDFLVAYHLVLKRTQTVTILSNYAGYDLSRTEMAKKNLLKFTEPKKPGEGPLGFVIIDILDPVRQQLLWRGWAKTNLTGAQDPNRLSGIIKAAVDRALESFPAKSTGG